MKASITNRDRGRIQLEVDGRVGAQSNDPVRVQSARSP